MSFVKHFSYDLPQRPESGGLPGQPSQRRKGDRVTLDPKPLDPDPPATLADDWWQAGVVYQIYPRSFAASPSGPCGDGYLWRDPAGRDRRGRPRPPNNWLSFFGGSGWTWDEGRQKFYFHTFLAEQPDLNWRNPAVPEAQLAMVHGWLDRGVDGFPLGGFHTFYKHAH